MDFFYSHAYSNMGNVDNSFSNSDEEMFWKMNKQHQMVSATIVESAIILELFNTNELTLHQNGEPMNRTFCDYVFTLVKSHIRHVFCGHQTFLIKIMTTLLRLLIVVIYTIITCL
jgi:hypothetical protein